MTVTRIYFGLWLLELICFHKGCNCLAWFTWIFITSFELLAVIRLVVMVDGTGSRCRWQSQEQYLREEGLGRLWWRPDEATTCSPVWKVESCKIARFLSCRSRKRQQIALAQISSARWGFARVLTTFRWWTLQGNWHLPQGEPDHLGIFSSLQGKWTFEFA